MNAIAGERRDNVALGVTIGEPVGRRRWLAVLAGFIGVLIILRPGAESFSNFSPDALPPILAAVFYALAAILTRSKCADENPVTLSLALSVSFLVWGLGAGALVWSWRS